MKRGKISAEERSQILDLFINDKDVKEIAESLDRSEAAVSKVLSEIAVEETVEETDSVDEVVEVEEAPELKNKPKSFSKTEGGRGGVAVAHQNSAEQVDKINAQVAKQKTKHPAVYSIYKD